MVETLAETLLAAAAAAPPAAAVPAPQEKNILLYGREGDALTQACVNDALVYTQGGMANESTSRPRVFALLGRGATLRGIAAVIKPIIDKPAAGPALTVDQIAQALYVYNQAYLGQPPPAPGAPAGAPLPLPPMPIWRVGLRLTLPIEIDIGPMAAPVQVGLVTNRTTLAGWAALFSPLDAQRLQEPAVPLPIPGAVAGNTFPAALGSARTDALAAIALWRAGAVPALPIPAQYANRLLTNAYEVVFELIELLRELRVSDPAEELDFVLDMCDLMVREQAYMIGWTSAGHAVLRRMWDTLTALRTPVLPTDTTRYGIAQTVVSLGLRLNPIPALGGWFAPAEWGPDIVPVETPIDNRGGDVRSSGGKAPSFTVSVLGREVPIGKSGTIASGIHGPMSGMGEWSLTAPGDPVQAQVLAQAFPVGVASPQQLACLDIVRAIAPNEGALDAVQAADAGQLSIGVQQWTLMGNNELTVLMHRLGKNNPEHYDLLVGGYGLQTRLWAPTAAGAERPAPVPAADIAAANPYEAGAVSPYGADFATYVGLDQVPRNAAPARVPTGAGRQAFLGGAADNDTKRRWAARFRLLAMYSLDWNVTQVQTAVFRFQRLLDEHPGTPYQVAPAAGPGTVWALKELCSSTFAAAVLFDEHINVPGRIAADVRSAIAMALATGRSPYVPGAVPTQLTTEFLVRFSIDLTMVRRVFADGKKHRDGLLVDQFDRELPGEPGTFAGW